jgi:hypothetical protein
MIVNYDRHLFIVQASDRGGSATIRVLEDSIVDGLSLPYRLDAVTVGQMSIFRKPKSQMALGNFFCLSGFRTEAQNKENQN